MLAYGVYALLPETREERAQQAELMIDAKFTDNQQAFLDFVLAHYVREGVGELDQDKLAPLLKLRYHDSIADATPVGRIFAGFQKYLYQPSAA